MLEPADDELSQEEEKEKEDEEEDEGREPTEEGDASPQEEAEAPEAEAAEAAEAPEAEAAEVETPAHPEPEEEKEGEEEQEAGALEEGPGKSEGQDAVMLLGVMLEVMGDAGLAVNLQRKDKLVSHIDMQRDMQNMAVEPEWAKRFKEVENLTGGAVKLKANVVGACDSNPDCLHFMETNHSPRGSACIEKWMGELVSIDGLKWYVSDFV
eukprot:s434_g8.t1